MYCERPLSSSETILTWTPAGLTALSVETMTKAAAWQAAAASATVLVPKTLFLMASPGLASIIGTCLWAAQWKTTWGRSA